MKETFTHAEDDGREFALGLVLQDENVKDQFALSVDGGPLLEAELTVQADGRSEVRVTLAPPLTEGTTVLKVSHGPSDNRIEATFGEATFQGTFEEFTADTENVLSSWSGTLPALNADPLTTLSETLALKAEAQASNNKNKCKIRCYLEYQRCISHICMRIPIPQGRALCFATCTAKLGVCYARC